MLIPKWFKDYIVYSSLKHDGRQYLNGVHQCLNGGCKGLHSTDGTNV